MIFNQNRNAQHMGESPDTNTGERDPVVIEAVKLGHLAVDGAEVKLQPTKYRISVEAIYNKLIIPGV